MIVADRYARSLMQLAAESNQLEAVRKDMKLIGKVWNENREFALLLESPVIKTDKKTKVMNAIFKDSVSKLTLSFIALLATKHREAYIMDIASSFDEQYKKNKNILTAVITSARGLDDATRQKVVDLIRLQMKAEVELTEKIDKGAIGGFMLKIGDKRIDKTVARQLSNIKKQFINKELN